MSVFVRAALNGRKIYWFRVRVNGKDYQRTTKQGDKEEALRQEAEFRTSFAAGGIKKADPRYVVTLADFGPRFIRFCRDQRQTLPSTLAFYQRALDKLIEGMGDTPLSLINAEVFSDYVDQRMKSERQMGRFTTIRRERQVLVTLLRYASATGKIGGVPILFNPGRGEKHREFIPDEKQFAAYLNAANPTLRDAAILSASCGLRPGEICALTPSQVRQVEDGFVITLAHSKSDQGRRPIYLNASNAAAACAVLASRISQAQMFETTVDEIGKAHARLRKKLGLPTEFVFYSFRHLYITRAGANTTPQQLRELARHADLKTTMIYYNPTEDDRRDAASNVRLLMPKVG